MHDEFGALFEEYKATYEGRAKAAREKAEGLAEELLTPAWRRLIGPAWKLVRALMVFRAEADAMGPAGEHVFGSLAEVGQIAGVSERTVQRWLSPTYAARPWLVCWLSWRAVYGLREDGLPCRLGTVFRVSLQPRPTHDLVPGPRPSLAALKAPWRLWSELPGAEDPALSNTRHETPVNRTFRQERKVKPKTLKAEGRDVTVASSAYVGSNTRQSGSSRWTARSSESWAKAQTVVERLGDAHSTAFWASRFLRAGASDAPIWSAVGQALEQRASGRLHRSAGAYAAGILRKTMASA